MKLRLAGSIPSRPAAPTLRNSAGLFGEAVLRDRQLLLELVDRSQEIVAAAARRLGGHGIVKMIGIGDAGALLFRPDLRVEIVIFPHQIGDHRLDVVDLALFFVAPEAMKPDAAILVSAWIPRYSNKLAETGSCTDSSQPLVESTSLKIRLPR